MDCASRRKTRLPNKVNFAPRVALSYGIGGGGKPPKTVLRAGYGIFYNRFTYDLLLNMNRYNLDQQGQVQTIQSNPNGTPPDSTTQESLALPTFYRTQPGLNAPAIIETGTGIEHQVNKSVSVSATYLYSRGIHQLLSRNIDAPTARRYPAGVWLVPQPTLSVRRRGRHATSMSTIRWPCSRRTRYF